MYVDFSLQVFELQFYGLCVNWCEVREDRRKRWGGRQWEALEGSMEQVRGKQRVGEQRLHAKKCSCLTLV